MTSVSAVVRAPMSIPQKILVGIIKVYQWTISPLLGPRCKYYPSCSNYGLQAVRRHGAIKGFALGAWRVLRCNPWSHGGVDDVPGRGEPLFRRGAIETSKGTEMPATNS